MEKAVFDIKLEEKDATAFAKLHFFRTKINFFLFFVIFTIIFVSVGIVRISEGVSDYTTYLAMIVGPVLFAVFYTSMLRTAKSNFHNRKIGDIVMTYIFSEDGISQKADDYEHEIKWNDIYRVVESKDLIAIYVSKVQSMTVPKDKISDETLNFIKNLLSKSIDKKKNGLI